MIIAGVGELAQLVERCDRTAEVRGSSPLFSTLFAGADPGRLRRRPLAPLSPSETGFCKQPEPMNWSSEAEQQLREVPFLVRPVVRRRIESMAAEAGLSAVDLSFYEQAKARFGQK